MHNYCFEYRCINMVLAFIRWHNGDQTHQHVYVSPIAGVSKCLQEQCWVDETPYEVQGVTVGESRPMVTEAPRKGRENASQKVSC